MKRILFSLGIVFGTTIHAQPPVSPQQSSSEILQGIKKLNTVGSVLYIAAHPDDENTRLLAYLSNERNLRTGYLSLTRGDGGQNLVGKEQGELLGIIRTQELLAARRTDGAEQFFTRANDFGYSKNPEETFRIWNKDSLLSDMVWTIRQFKPDVLICRFPTTGEGGHGHHTASAILAMEAFDAAGDPKKFPQQLKYVSVWQPKRIFWNTFNFGGPNNTPSDPSYLKLDVGVFNPLLGKGYGEIAADSRSMHKSQGFGSAKNRGEDIEQFKWLKGEPAKTDLFEDIEQGWKKFSEGKKMSEMVDACMKNFDVQHPEKSIPALLEMYQYLNTSMKSDPSFIYWRKQKIKEIEKLIGTCAGLFVETYAATYSAIPGNEVNLSTKIVNRNGYPIKLEKISYLQQVDSYHEDSSLDFSLERNKLYTFKHREKLKDNLPFSNPYWLNEKHEPGTFIIKDRQLIGKPENDPAAAVEFTVNIDGTSLKITRAVTYKFVDPVRGEVYRPFEILPPATVNIPEKAFVFSDAQPRSFAFTVKANAPNVSGTLDVQVPTGWNIETKNNTFSLNKAGDEILIQAVLSPGKNPSPGKLSAHLKINNQTYGKSIQRIEYDHIPYQFVLSDAEVSLVNVNLVKAGTRIGYIQGAGDDVPAALKQIGYTVTMLTDEQLLNEDLNKNYDAIVTGVRAYNTNDRMPVYYKRLMEYVSKGGNMVVQYNTNNRIGPMNVTIGPYPLTISRDRVTDEHAEVKFLKKESPVLHYPNAIGEADFKDWVQERGIYFATERDSAYEAVLGMHDAGENEMDGSLITAQYGKGRFIYTGLVFFRELPAGVPGAYRLFVNLLSLPPRNQ